ncbi:fibronectin 1 [Cichlidogyrus casuarinus]|uniref:Fibronectin 1 n=1 Tax=Cichlidogyrus casuarinus TaxID=1844966 RepID=A0ABD2PV15_9PLAT
MKIQVSPSKNSIRLSWNAPSTIPGQVISGYQIRYEADSFSQTAKSTATTYNLINLLACTTYSVAVTPFVVTGSNSLFCDETPLVFTQTFPPSPNPVFSLNATSPDSNQIAVSIVPGPLSAPSSCTNTMYKLTLLTQGNTRVGEVEMSQNNFVFTKGIIPNTAYTVSARAIHSRSTETSAAIVMNVRTGTDSPNRPSAPTGLSAVGSTANSISISWTAPNEKVSGYAVTYSSKSSSGFVRISNAVETSFTITGLNPCTEYSIKMQSINMVSGADLLSTNSSLEVVNSTANPIPSTPDSVTIAQLNYTSMLLTISDRNLVQCGSLAYSVEVFMKRTGRIIKIYDYLLKPATGSTLTLLNLNQTVAPELLEGYTYFTRVAAQDITANLRGFVVVSRDLYMVPSQPVPNSPTGLKSDTVTANTVTLTWTPPTGSISGYQIVYTDAQSFASVYSVNSTTASKVTLTGLFPCAQYTVYIIALSQAEKPIPSQPSNIITINTLVTTTSLSSVVLTQTSPTTASLSLFGPLPICPSTYLMTQTTNGIAGRATSSIDRRKYTRLYHYFLVAEALTGLEVGNSYSITIIIISNNLAGTLTTSNEITMTSSFTPQPRVEFEVQLSAAVAGADGNNQVYTPTLANVTSPEFMAISNYLCRALKIFLTNAPGSFSAENCSVSTLNPGSVIALTRLVVVELPDSGTKTIRSFDPTSTIANGMANTPRSQVALLLDKSSLNATSQVIRESENALPALRIPITHLLCMQLIMALTNRLANLF